MKLKKLLTTLLSLLTLSLMGCSKGTESYRTEVYCYSYYQGYVGVCSTQFKKWSDLKKEDLEKAMNVSCTDLTTDSYHPHQHYCVTWIV